MHVAELLIQCIWNSYKTNEYLLYLKSPSKSSRYDIIPIWQIRKLRIKKVRQLANVTELVSAWSSS